MIDQENIQKEKKNKTEKKVAVEADKRPTERNVENASDQKQDESQPSVASKKKKKKKGPKLLRGKAQAYIKATYNNTVVTVTDHNGNAVCASSAGKCGFKGPKKSTPYAAGIIVRSLIDKVKSFGIKDLDIFVKGVGLGREAAIRAFGAHGISVSIIKDITPIPHNGCRPKKPRRV